MEWNNKAGKSITKVKADEMIDRYQKENKNGIRSIYFDKDVIQGLLEIKGCEGISIIFAKNGEGNNTVVLMPVDEQGKNIYERSDTEISLTRTKEAAVNVGSPCPPYCPTK